MRSHFGRRPIAQPAVVHGKAVVMFCNGHDVFCTRFFEQLAPGGRIKMLGLEHGDKVFISELVLWSVSSDMVLLCVESRLIHISGIPFTAKSRDRVSSPMNENAELRVLVPFGYFILLK